MRVGGARSARSVRTAATEGTRGSGFAPRRPRHRAPNDRRNAGKSVRLRPRASLARRLSLEDRLYPLPTARLRWRRGRWESSRDVFRFDDESFLRRRFFFFF
jgi:hypothetical protein